MDKQKVFRRSDRIISRRIVDELILVPVRNSVAEMESLYTLNDVGARIYELLDGKRSVGDISNVIREEFEVSAQEAESDVAAFIEKLLSIGSIEDGSA